MLIINGNVFTGTAFQDGMDIRLENGIISETGRGITPEPGESVIDLKGDFLLPGFVDVHIHAFRGYDTMRGEYDIRNMSRELARTGTGAFCPTTMSASVQDTAGVLSDIRKVIERPEGKGARVLGAHIRSGGDFACRARNVAHRPLQASGRGCPRHTPLYSFP